MIGPSKNKHSRPHIPTERESYPHWPCNSSKDQPQIWTSSGHKTSSAHAAMHTRLSLLAWGQTAIYGASQKLLWNADPNFVLERRVHERYLHVHLRLMQVVLHSHMQQHHKWRVRGYVSMRCHRIVVNIKNLPEASDYPSRLELLITLSKVHLSACTSILDITTTLRGK